MSAIPGVAASEHVRRVDDERARVGGDLVHDHITHGTDDHLRRAGSVAGDVDAQ
jgi:hypothetical protein